MPGQCVINSEITVAAGVFAPGHLGELTQVIDFDLVDAVLAETGRTQKRVRLLPARVVVYFVLALALFASCGYRRVWAKLGSGLAPLALAAPGSSALTQARRRVGAKPLRRLFEVLAGPVARPGTPGAFWRGLRTVIIDGTLLAVPDDAAVTGRYGKRSGATLSWGYPQARLLALVECGTRAILAATFGPEIGNGTGEKSYARDLVGGLRADMLLLADAGFDSAALLAQITATGARFLVRSGASRRPLILRVLSDGSYLAVLPHRDGPLAVRMVEAWVTVTLADGRARTEPWRLVTNLLDHHRYPATDLIALYHQRWEIETAIRSIKSTILDGRVLRSHRPDDIDQEVHALLCVYQAIIRIAVDAADSVPGLDPDRISFTVICETARNQVINAHGVIPTQIELVGQIGRAALAHLLPPRRQRTKTRCRKVATSKYSPKAGWSPATQPYTLDTKIAIFEEPLTARRKP